MLMIRVKEFFLAVGKPAHKKREQTQQMTLPIPSARVVAAEEDSEAAEYSDSNDT